MNGNLQGKKEKCVKPRQTSTGNKNFPLIQIDQLHVLQGTTPDQGLLSPKTIVDISIHPCCARQAQNEPPYQG